MKTKTPIHDDHFGKTYVLKDFREEIMDWFPEDCQRIKFVTAPFTTIDGKAITVKSRKTEVLLNENILNIVRSVVEEALSVYKDIIYFYNIYSHDATERVVLRFALESECEIYDEDAEHQVSEEWTVGKIENHEMISVLEDTVSEYGNDVFLVDRTMFEGYCGNDMVVGSALTYVSATLEDDNIVNKIKDEVCKYFSRFHNQTIYFYGVTYRKSGKNVVVTIRYANEDKIQNKLEICT